MSQKSRGSLLEARAVVEARTSRQGKNTAHKMAEAIAKAGDSMSLEPFDFGWYMSVRVPTFVQRKMFACFLAWMYYLADQADKDYYYSSDEEMMLCKDAQALRDGSPGLFREISLTLNNN